MTPTTEVPSGSERTVRRPAEDARADVASLARVILSHAIAVGVVADLLLRSGFTGPGFPVWLALLALATVAVASAGSRTVPHESLAWLATAIAFGVGMAWRDAGALQSLDFVATLFALGMAAVSLGDARSALFATRMRDTLWAGAVVIGSVAAGAVALVLRDIMPPAGASRAPRDATPRAGPALRAALIALPIVLIFGILLRDADPVFASFLALPDVDVATIASHVVVSGFFAWVMAGWARGAMLADLAPGRAPNRLPFSLGMLDVTVVLGALNLLFALYVATQLGWLFGGEQFLQARTGLTVAEYARQGFFQMVWVALLVIPVLLITRAALRDGAALERRHTALAIPLLLLLGAMILSAVLRMRLYVQYFGLTLDRLYPLVFMGWLVAVLAWLALTVLRGDGRFFAAGAVVAGLATLAALNVVVPDVVVARVNIARAASGASLDLQHLASLGGEAMPLVVPAVLAPQPFTSEPAARDATNGARCAAARTLLRRWGPSSRRVIRREEDSAWWRGWNRGEAVAERAVRAQARDLREVIHSSCAPNARR